MQFKNGLGKETASFLQGASSFQYFEFRKCYLMIIFQQSKYLIIIKIKE